MPSLKELTYKSIHNWCYRFLQRNELTLRAVTHIGQTIKNNSSEAMANFILYCQDAIKKLNIKIPEDLNAIGNVDETPVFFEMYQNKTIAKIGAKKVNIKSFGCDKLRISIILKILANGDKLAPLIVFKGKPGKTLETRLSKHIHCINEKIFVKTQENSWVDKDIFKFWLHNIWFKYNKLHSKKKSLLILDRATSHYYENISDDFKRNDGNYVLIPPGLTRFLQPLDISINFPFKNALKKNI